MKSDRIYLINCDEKLLKTILKGDKYLSQKLEINIPNQWCNFGKEIFGYTLEKIKEKPTEVKWFSYLAIENKTRTLIGSCGFKGAPDQEGMVEIGYEVAEDFRNQGYATEMTRLLIDLAFMDEKVKKIQAHTFAEKNASVRVLEKCNFNFIKESHDENDHGLIWKWVREPNKFT